MITERASALEHISSAVTGEGERDWVGALAMAQLAPGRIGAAEARALRGVVDPGVGSQAAVTALGIHLARLQQAGDQITYDQACRAMAGMVLRLNVARRWGLTKRQAERVAEAALLLHLHPKCGHCRGRQFEPIPDTPSLSKIECPACGGTGNRPIPKKNHDEIASTLHVLQLILGMTEQAAARRRG